MKLGNIKKATSSTALKSKPLSKNKKDININLIQANPFQPRFNEEVEDLKASIKESGIIQAITLTKKGTNYVIVAGHRRFKAWCELGHTMLPAEYYNIIKLEEHELQTLAIVENLQREDLHPLELAISVDNAINNGINRDALSKHLGKSKSYISKCLSILKLSGVILDHLQKNNDKIGLEILVDLQRLKDEAMQELLFFDYINGKITRDDIRNEISNLKAKPKKYKKNTRFVPSLSNKKIFDEMGINLEIDKEYKIIIEEV